MTNVLESTLNAERGTRNAESQSSDLATAARLGQPGIQQKLQDGDEALSQGGARDGASGYLGSGIEHARETRAGATGTVALPENWVGSEEPNRGAAGEMVCGDSPQRLAASAVELTAHDGIDAHETSLAALDNAERGARNAEQGISNLESEISEGELTARGAEGELLGNIAQDKNDRADLQSENHTQEAPRAATCATWNTNIEHPTSNDELPTGGNGGNGAAPNQRTMAARRREEERLKEAHRRKEVLDAFNGLFASGVPARRAAKLVKQGLTTLERWQKAFDAKGFNGLIPRTDKCGRKSTLEKLGLSEHELEALLRGLNLDLDSTTATLRAFAQSDRCPEELAAVILQKRSSKHALPPSLRRAAKINDNMKKAHRGPRTLSLKGFWIPRRLDVLPGDVFSSDDTTAIWGCWVPWQECEEYPFGVKLLQVQHLPIFDVGSQAVLTYGLIAREKSSYRACDIWANYGHLFDTIGLPRLGVQHERASWEAAQIAGMEVEIREGEVSWERRVGGLRQLPTNVTEWHRERLNKLNGLNGANPMDCFPKTLQTWTSYLPKSKSIEALFNRSQTFEGTIYGCLGRDQMRAPFEKAKHLYQQCSRPRAKIDPREHFLSLAEVCRRLNQIYAYLNNEPMEGEVFSGIPRMKFETATREYPLFFLPEDQRWLYRRDWKPLTITQGWARVRLTHPVTGERYSLHYENASVFAEIEGAQVVVYYDRENFEAPAQVIAASECKVRGERFRPGDYICEARYFERPGMFLDGDRSGHEIAKAWRNAVMTAYGTIVGHAPSRQVPAEIEARRAQTRNAERGARNNAEPTRQNLSRQAEATDRRDADQSDRDGRAPRIEVRANVPAPRTSVRAKGPSEEDLERRRKSLRQQAALVSRLPAQE